MAGPDYGPYFQASGQLHDIDPLLLQAIQMQEDRSGDPNAVGPPNKSGELARGVMQFLPSTAAKYGVNPSDPGSSILGAGAYLADLRKATNDNLPQMLAQYGGGNATGYANEVLGRYRQLQKSWGVTAPPADDQGDQSSAVSSPTSGDQDGIKITARALPGPGGAAQGGASFVPPPGTPDTFGRSNAPGSRAQHPMQASEYASDQPPADFNAQLFGPEPAPAKQEPPAQATAAPAASPPPAPAAPAPPSDFNAQLFGPAPAPSAPAPSAAPPAVPDVTTPSAAASAPATTAPQPSWWQANVADPVRAMYDPTTAAPMNYLLGQPLLQNIGAGILQGPRNVAQRFNEWEQAADQAHPALAAIDASVGETPDVLAARGNRLAAQTQAYRTQYGNNLAAAGGELAGNLLTTYPLAAIGGVLGAVGNAVPLIRGGAEVANVAATPAAQNILTTPGEDWRQAGAEGAAGGLAVHGVLGSVAGQLTRGAVSQAVQDARDLGFNLTTGEAAGGLAKQVEDVTQYLPFSGAAAKAAEHRGVINGVLNENMGMPKSPVLNQATMQTARARAGNLMDQIQNVAVDANRDPNLLSELGQIHAEAAAQPMTGTSITGAIDNIMTTAANNGGTLPGDVLHDLIKRGATLDRLTNSPDPVIRQFAQRIDTSLQDAASRTDDPNIYGAQAAQNRQAVTDFNNGRYYWKTIKTVEPLVDKTGSADDVGYAGLARRIEGTPQNPNFDPRFSGGNQQMATLARVLRGPLAELKSSGTGRQLITGQLLGLGGETGGLTALFRPENFNQYLSQVATPTLASIGAGRLLRYGPGMGIPAVQAANQLFNPLLPRVAGPAVGANPLLSQPPQQGQ